MTSLKNIFMTMGDLLPLSYEFSHFLEAGVTVQLVKNKHRKVKNTNS